MARFDFLRLSKNGSVIDHDDFVWKPTKRKLEVEMLDGGGDAALLVPRGDDDRKQCERSSGIGFRKIWHFYSFPIHTGRPAGRSRLASIKR